MSQPRFVADSMLGTLARRLRMLGIDTVYIRDAGQGELKSIVHSQKRILLTRNQKLAVSLGEKAWPVSGTGIRGEFRSVSSRLAAAGALPRPFSLCLECNLPLNDADPLSVRHKVPPYVLKTVKRFVRCPGCERVYWEGTHGVDMGEEVRWMQSLVEGHRQ